MSQATGGRTEQQDSVAVLEGKNYGTTLAILADGAGGHRGGRMASQKALETSRQLFARAGLKLQDPVAQLTALCREAHNAINRLAETAKSAPRSTLVALYVEGDSAWWVNVGDSRLYRVREGRVTERTKDHTMAQILFEQGEIKDAEIPHHPDRTQLLRALGGEELYKPSLGSAEIAVGDGFVLCSDGFWENTPPAMIAALVSGKLSQRTLDEVVEAAASANGANGDNVTACALVVTEPSTR
ncbi:MAG: serine/threonine-protein phosphatase [Chthoniobacterales bacterium]|nr:serine/threonine-protein phosphatase [Chthoniobacterales bacterium]